MKKTISILLIGILVINLFSSPVYAMENNSNETVYVDGVEFEVSLNDDFEIVVRGESGDNVAQMILESDGEAELEIENEEIDEDRQEFELEINDLKMNEVNVEVCQDNEIVEEYTTVEEVFEDEYEGQVAIAAGGITITIGMVLEALLYAALAVVVAGVVYIVVTKFYSAVESATAKKKKKAKKYYYPAYIWGTKVAVSPKAISKTKAIKRVKQKRSVYSFTSALARSIIVQAGYSYYPTGSKGEINSSKKSGGIYLYHYHQGTKNGRPIHNNFHSFYGVPVVVK